MKLNLKPTKISQNNVKSFGTALLLAMFTSYLLIATIIALPKVDSIVDGTGYNILTKDDLYWKGAYILELSISKDEKRPDLKVEQTKNVIHRRLKSYGVEEVRITDYTYSPEDETEEIEQEEFLEEDSLELETEEDDFPELETEENNASEEYNQRYIRVVVQSSQDKESVETLISSRSYIQIMTVKDGVDIEDPENQIAQYLPSNYDYTEFTRSSFRTIHIKRLPTVSGEEAYFAIYKPWIFVAPSFNSMLKENAGEIVGINTDGFVTPYTVPYAFATPRDSNNSTRPEFAPGVAQTSEQAEVVDLLYNSGIVPVRYLQIDSEELDVKLVNLDYIDLFLSVIVASVVLLGYLAWRKKDDGDKVLRFGITLLFIISTWIAYLKLFEVPVDLFMVLLQGITLLAITCAFTFRSYGRYQIELITIVSLMLFASAAEGYAQIFSEGLLVLTAFAVLGVWLTKFYIDNLKKMIK
jgi:hypothetical protein